MEVSDFVVNGATKIKMLLAAKGMNMKGLAELLETSQPNLSAKMKRENFSEKELQQIAEKLGAKLEITFVLEDGTKI